MHVQATGTTCNVTVFDINNPTSVILNPTKPCDHSIYNKTCTAFQGALLIDISPALDARTGKLLKQQNPDIQVPTLTVKLCAAWHGTAIIECYMGCPAPASCSSSRTLTSRLPPSR